MSEMRKLIQVFAILCAVFLLSGAEARRVRIRPQRPVENEETADQEEQPQRVTYYSAESQEGRESHEPRDEPQDEPRERDEPQQKFVLLPNGGEVLNGLYGRPVERTGTDSNYHRVLHRPAGLIAQPRPTRVRDSAREPPVQTIKNYSKVNDDGSFTFGYESADGSFKEETRGVDCVVRGKYGYVDPDGNKREFSYVSGNPCDPNAPNQEDEEEKDEEESGEENVPQNIPQRPLRPLRPIAKPVSTKPPTTFFQQDFNSLNPESGGVSHEEAQQPQIYLQPTPASVPAPVPVSVPESEPVPSPVPTRIRGRVPTRPVPVQLPVPTEKPENIVRVTPRPAIPTTPASLPATTYRPQLLVSFTPRPSVAYAKHGTLNPSTPLPPPSPTPIGSVDFEEELKRFQLENNVVTTPKTLVPSTTHKAPPAPSGHPVYTTELVYDPSTGQYNTVLYQQVPKAAADLSLKSRLPQLQPQYQPQHQLQQQHQLQFQFPQQLQHQPQFHVQPQRPTSPRQNPSHTLQQQLFDQQKQLLFQQSQDLYNQQRNQLQSQQHRFQPTFTPTTIQYQPLPSSATPTAASKTSATGPQKFDTHSESAQRVTSSRIPNPQQFYYFAPQYDAHAQSIATGQIDAFLRGHNYQF